MAMDLRNRIICLNGTIDDATSSTIVAQLLYLESENPSKPVSLGHVPLVVHRNSEDFCLQRLRLDAGHV